MAARDAATAAAAERRKATIASLSQAKGARGEAARGHARMRACVPVCARMCPYAMRMEMRVQSCAYAY